MKYRDGKKVLLGDSVRTYGNNGKIVIDLDSRMYADGFTEDDWGDLRTGVMIRCDNGALFHLHEADIEEPDELILIKRESK